MALRLGLGLPSRRMGFDPYAAGGFAPEFVADFRGNAYRIDGSPSDLTSAISFTRTGTSTYADGSGAIQTAAANTLRSDHHIWNGSGWERAGALLEPSAATNLLHTTNALVTQSVTVTAQAYTLHFTGTGTITLSGASTDGPLVGTGTGEQNRVSLTFTPSAGSLTLTVSGTVTNAQLEAGTVQSSYIPNLAGSGTATRNAEALSIAAADLPWNSSAMSIALKGRMSYADDGIFAQFNLVRWFASSTNRIVLALDTNSTRTGEVRYQQTASGTNDQTASPGDQYAPGLLVPFSIASRHGSTFINGAANGTAFTENTTPTALADLSATDMEIGQSGGPLIIDTLRVWGADIGNAGIARASA